MVGGEGQDSGVRIQDSGNKSTFQVPGVRLQGPNQDSGVRSQESGVRMKSICFSLSAFRLLTSDS